MSDVYIFQTVNDGDINIEAGVVELRGGIESSVYLSLFSAASDWWGDIGEPSAQSYDAGFQRLLDEITLTSAALPRVEKEAERNLSWMLLDEVASSISVTATIPALNTLGLAFDIQAQGEESQFSFVLNWQEELNTFNRLNT